MTKTHAFEVIIVGGSFAGLSAALCLGRMLRRVLVIDNNRPCNRSVRHSHNLLCHDGDSPDEILRQAKKQLSLYKTVTLVKEEAVKAEKLLNFFRVTTDTARYESICVLFATGARDIMPAIPGFKACWGKTILHCPYCHGYEVRGNHVAVLGDSRHAFHLCAFLSRLGRKVTLVTDGRTRMTPSQLKQLRINQVRIVTGVVKKIHQQEGNIKKIEFKDGISLQVQVVFAKVQFIQASRLARDLGCRTGRDGQLFIDRNQRTSVEGVYAAGDNSESLRSLSLAIAAGTRAGFAIDGELTMRHFNSPSGKRRIYSTQAPGH